MHYDTTGPRRLRNALANRPRAAQSKVLIRAGFALRGQVPSAGAMPLPDSALAA